MQTSTSETKRKFFVLKICVHHYTLRSPCAKGQKTLAKHAKTLSILINDHSTLSNWATENSLYIRTVRGRERNVFPCRNPRDTMLPNFAVSISK